MGLNDKRALGGGGDGTQNLEFLRGINSC